MCFSIENYQNIYWSLNSNWLYSSLTVVPNSSSNEEGPIADYPLKWNYTLRQLALMLHLVSGVPRETTWDKTRRFVVTSCSKFFKVCANYSNFCQLYQLASTSCNVSSSVLMITITLETSCSEVVGWNPGYIILWHSIWHKVVHPHLKSWWKRVTGSTKL